MRTAAFLALAALAGLLIALAVHLANDCGSALKIGGLLIAGCQ